MLKITVEFGGKVLNTFSTDKNEAFIGRNGDNDIQIDNLAVSGRHARIFKEKEAYVIEDLASTNGTLVDGLKVSRKTINHRHRITIGKHTLSIHTDQSPSVVPDFLETIKIDRKGPGK
jgi:pSer/pThr/pTyr-binding forkhead associated (FHA) protein